MLIKLLNVILLLLIVLTCVSCENINEIENTQIITACFITSESDLKYTFMVASPSGDNGGEEKGSLSSVKTYEFTADNFSHAINLFKKSGAGRIDLSHLILLMADENYYNVYLWDDVVNIRNYISISSLVSVGILKSSTSDFVECISSVFDSNVNRFVSNLLKKEQWLSDSNLSKLLYSGNNELYTAKIPGISIIENSGNKLPKITDIYFVSARNGITLLSPFEFNILKEELFLTNLKYSIRIQGGVCIVSGIENMDLVNICYKYYGDGTDILNVKYKLRRNFMFYDDYIDFVKGYNIVHTIFEVNK